MESVTEPTSPHSEADDGEENGDATAVGYSPAATLDQKMHLPDGEDHVTSTPLYWSAQTRHARSTSYHSISNQRPHPILLEDHSEEDHELSQSCWAESATIDEYVLVSGATGIGAYVAWHCTVKTLKGGDLTIRKR